MGYTQLMHNLAKEKRMKSTELRLILAMAPSFQGGHSKIGDEVAEYLGIPFPLTTSNLEKKAKEHGFDPHDLWPWLKQIRDRQADQEKMDASCGR